MWLCLLKCTVDNNQLNAFAQWTSVALETQPSTNTGGREGERHPSDFAGAEASRARIPGLHDNTSVAKSVRSDRRAHGPRWTGRTSESGSHGNRPCHARWSFPHKERHALWMPPGVGSNSVGAAVAHATAKTDALWVSPGGAGMLGRSMKAALDQAEVVHAAGLVCWSPACHDRIAIQAGGASWR